MLELIEYKNPKGRPVPDDARQADNGFIHISFYSTDIHKDYTRLSEIGIKFFSEPVELRPDVWAVYLHGPDNEVCALRQAG